MTSIPQAPWNAPPDPRERLADQPLITWRGQRDARQRAARERSVVTAADLVAPASVDRHAHDVVRMGETYSTSFAVLTLPRVVRTGAFARLACLPGVATTIVNNPVSRSLAKERVQELGRRMGVSLNQNGDEHADEELALRDVQRHLTALTEEREGHHLFGIYLTVTAANPGQLALRIAALRDVCVDLQLQITRCDDQHWEGALTTAPLGYDQLRYLRETDTSTLARLVPSRGANLAVSPRGVPILIGMRADGSDASAAQQGVPVLLDRFTLPSPHQAVIAATGGGKTYAQCAALLQRFAYGQCSICVIDPKGQEYRQFIEQTLGGTYLVLSERSTTRLNPLMLPYGDAQRTARLRALDTDVRAARAALVKQLVATEAQARGMPLRGRAEAQLEEAIFAAYDACGITADPATFHADVPILSDVVTQLIQRHADPELIAHMELFTTGTLGRLLNAPGNLPLAVPPSRLRADVGVLGVDLSQFVQGNDATLKRVLPALIANYFITVAMTNQHPMELVIDEAWSLLQTEAGAAVLEVIARIGRSLQVAATVITQQVREFLYRRAGDYEIPNASGRTYLDNCETVLLLRQLRPSRAGAHADDNPVAMAARQFGLTPGEMAWLSSCRRDADGATGLLIVGREPIPLRIPRAPEPLHTMIIQASVARASRVPTPEEATDDTGT